MEDQMALFKSGNPTLNARTFSQFGQAANDSEAMTISGTVNKVGILLALLMIAAYFTWNFTLSNPGIGYTIVIGGTIAALIVAIIVSFKKQTAPVLAPVYAIFEGLALGGLSAYMDTIYPGIAIEALTLTFTIFLSLLVIYKFKIIKATENFKLIVASATAGVALYYVASMVAGLFHVNLPLIHSSSMFGIGFSLFVVILAAANLVVDFDFIEAGAENRVPKFMEWYGAFGLLVTLVWLYVEILRLLSKLRSRN
jgi:uncharacterized YccA/Bax inhibitor family protein